MNKYQWIKALFFSLVVLMIFSLTACSSSVDTLRYGVFGKIVIYKPAATPKALVLFVSGDGGWNSGVVQMAGNLVVQGAMVAGINIKSYLKALNSLSSSCYYPAADFEDASLMIQKKYKFPAYHKPILVGYSSGATLVYGILAQAPAATFKGAIALGFCPDIEINKPLCAGSGLKQHVLKAGQSFYLEPAGKLTAPFIALNGTKDQICNFAETSQFIKEVNMGQIIELPLVGHGFSVLSSWTPQFRMAYQRVLDAPSFSEQKTAQNTLLQSQKLAPLPVDLPVTLLPSAQNEDSKPMVFLISGDGGWTSFDHTLGESMAEKGMPVVGLDAQNYFWNLKTPEKCAQEIGQAVEHYLQQWDKKNFILVGYSFGANVIPFIADKMTPELKDALTGLYCLSPNEKADFEIHLMDMLGFGGKRESYNVPNQINKMRQFTTTCIFGDEEDKSLPERFKEAGAQVITIPGNHHYNNNPARAGQAIVQEAEKSSAQ
ncbi:MAG: AcvB/VirJ family lysyl-phosphatidylglycerol hydrolase [Candidatus Saccharibacteria bacterium]